jgi:glutathione S-transferase
MSDPRAAMRPWQEARAARCHPLEDAMKLYEFGPTRSIRARWTLQELGVDFEAIPVNLMQGAHHRPEFVKLNPAAKLPVFVDGDFTLTESGAIVLYLAEKYPEKGFVPRDVRGRAEMNRWLLFTITELEQPLWRITKHRNLYPEADRLPAEIPLAQRDFRDMAKVIEAHLKGREFVVGTHVTVADFVLAYTLDWANEAGLLEGFPTLAEYMTRMYARPHAPLRIKAAFAKVADGSPPARG